MAWNWGRAHLFRMSGHLNPLSPGLWDDRGYGKPLMKEDHPANTMTKHSTCFFKLLFVPGVCV